ncbi:1067_t:CDS:2, partial [Cetraspora pellucida]
MSLSNSKSPICEQNELLEDLKRKLDNIECFLDGKHERKHLLKRLINNNHEHKEETNFTDFIDFYKNTWLDSVQKGVNYGNSVFPVIGGAVGGLLAFGAGYLSFGTELKDQFEIDVKDETYRQMGLKNPEIENEDNFNWFREEVTNTMLNYSSLLTIEDGINNLKEYKNSENFKYLVNREAMR